MSAAPTLDAAFAALPLPAAVFDAGGRFAALNEAAEIWLNLSSRSVAGLAPDDPALFARLRVPADLPGLIAAVRQGEDPLARPLMVFQIGDRAGGWELRRAAVHLAPLPGGGAVAVIRPDDAMEAAPRHGARTAIGVAEMLAHEIKNPL
ncbi:MAG TPA: PAS domain-containing sensor histidine kinase, partial [Paracoccus sp. (in: a-proteobacteria)]|nr:PAS domain-containing sensor histidine kinase [Paracoccus sp. (in: a-proteobacteria)]